MQANIKELHEKLKFYTKEIATMKELLSVGEPERRKQILRRLLDTHPLPFSKVPLAHVVNLLKRIVRDIQALEAS
jgi:hypothetical protein